MARVTAQDILRPKRWRTAERWPGVPYTFLQTMIPCDLPAATCQKRRGLQKSLARLLPVATASDCPPPLRTGDLILSVAGIPASPVHALRLATFLASTPAGTPVPFRHRPDQRVEPREINITLELPAAMLDPSDLNLPFEPVTLHSALRRPPSTVGICHPRPAMIEGRPPCSMFTDASAIAAISASPISPSPPTGEATASS